MIELDCCHAAPTSPGMYVHCSVNVTEFDGRQALTPVWVFDYHGQLLFMPLGHVNSGQPLAAFPYLAGNRWSMRITPRVSIQGETDAQSR